MSIVSNFTFVNISPTCVISPAREFWPQEVILTLFIQAIGSMSRRLPNLPCIPTRKVQLDLVPSLLIAALILCSCLRWYCLSDEHEMSALKRVIPRSGNRRRPHTSTSEAHFGSLYTVRLFGST